MIYVEKKHVIRSYDSENVQYVVESEPGGGVIEIKVCDSNGITSQKVTLPAEIAAGVHVALGELCARDIKELEEG